MQNHSTAYDKKTNNVFIYNGKHIYIYDLQTNELYRSSYIYLQPEPDGRPQIQIIEGNLYLIGIFKNSKYSVYRAEIGQFHKSDSIGGEEKSEEEYSIAKLFNNKATSDIILKVDGKDIYANKEILV